MKRVLVTGAAGMLGRNVGAAFAELDTWEVFGLVLGERQQIGWGKKVVGDLTDSEFVRRILDDVNPHLIVHCAAIVDVDKCERDRKAADALHEQATAILASHNSGRVKFIYISTDAVFDGQQGGYAEDAPANPLNYYAASKRKGELAALAANHDAVVLRTNLYGFHIPPGSSLVEWALDNFSRHHIVNGFTDVFFNPLYTGQVARLITERFVHDDVRGIWHVGSDRSLSKYEFLIALAHSCDHSPTLVRPASVDSVSFAARRPKNTTLSTAKLSKLGGEIPRFDSGMQQMVNDYRMRWQKKTYEENQDRK